MEPVSLEDKQIITRQLGRSPRGVVGIAKRCTYGFPQVVTVSPLIDGKPFPTLYWLTCPFLFRAIASLEAGGMIRRIEEAIRRDSDLANRLVHAHRSYIEQRRRLLSREDLVYLEGKGILPALMERGIGGIADYSRIKCLHLHVAHALASDNPIGRIVLDLLARRECQKNQIICASFEDSTMGDGRVAIS